MESVVELSSRHDGSFQQLTVPSKHPKILSNNQISNSFFSSYAAPTKVTLGNNTATKQTTYTIENIIPHPDYNPDVASNDVMLVKTSQDIVMKNGSVWPIPLALTSADLLPYTNMTFTGWGLTNQALNTYPIDLQVVTYSLWPAGACWKRSTAGRPRQFYSSQTQMCAAAKNGTAGACNVDDGGPLVYKGILYGIASKLMNEPCASGFPDIFTKVSYYNDWIVKVMTGI